VEGDVGDGGLRDGCGGELSSSASLVMLGASMAAAEDDDDL